MEKNKIKHDIVKEKKYKVEREAKMDCIGNVIWFVFGGGIMGISWVLAGLLWSITIIGLPIGQQCFKMAKLAFFPFGKEVVYGGGGVSLVFNIIWLLISGFVLAVESLTIGCLFYLTIIGIPFGKQCFKMAKLALMPFGTKVI